MACEGSPSRPPGWPTTPATLAWTHEDYLAAVLDREVAARNASRKSLEEFDWDAQPAVRQQVAALASGGFLTEARNVVLPGPPGTGEHCAFLSQG
jgi:DNA replication protein DnaC